MYKTIEINGETFNYEVIYDVDAHGNVYEWTEFFKDTYEKTTKKFWLFGPLVTETIYDPLFTVNFDIESTFYTKEYTNKGVNKAYNNYIALLKRPEEIKNGEII